MARKAVPLAKKTYSNDPDSIPVETFPSGFHAAVAVVRRCEPDLRQRILDHTADSGLQGAPALEFFAALLLYHAKGGDIPIPHKLRQYEVDWVRQYARSVTAADL